MGRKVIMGRRQMVKIGRRQQRRWRKEKMGPRMGEKEKKERQDQLMARYYETLIKSEGFDVTAAPIYMNPIRPYHCDDGCCDLALLYARMGLHRYNLFQGKKLQLSRVKKYNKTSCTPINSYYITLVAEDPDCGSLQTFQTKVREISSCKFDLKCTVARLLGETKKTIDDEIDDDHPLPELPQEDPFVVDGTNRFNLLTDSELEDNDWIRLYLELAVATTNRSLAVKNESLTNLKIMKVATESSQELGDFDAVFYIEYEDSCEARVGKDVHRVAIVRRILDKQSELLCLRGHNQSINKSAAMEAGSSSAQD
ncbi:hypothetical protein HA466_0162320 [Hirschfeldia incana]|nr:hypothetical protein HA466_0162320 [Hirschfeldia incana]